MLRLLTTDLDKRKTPTPCQYHILLGLPLSESFAYVASNRCRKELDDARVNVCRLLASRSTSAFINSAGTELSFSQGQGFAPHIPNSCPASEADPSEVAMHF